MSKARVLVLTGYGTNCQVETAYIAQRAGADEVVIGHFADIIQERYKISDFNFLIFPGGFLDGDHLGAAQAHAIRLGYSRTKSGSSLLDSIQRLFSDGGLILGICNGFQLLVKLGLLPAYDQKYYQRQVSLSYNDSSRFEDRWVRLKCNPASPCIFTRNLESLYLPVRHGEGKLTVLNETIMQGIQHENLIALQYVDQDGQITQKYPENPNGSPLAIAGLTDPSGQILGLMPHPEAYNHVTNHPSWTRGLIQEQGSLLFGEAISYLQNNVS